MPRWMTSTSSPTVPPRASASLAAQEAILEIGAILSIELVFSRRLGGARIEEFLPVLRVQLLDTWFLPKYKVFHE